MDGRPRPSLGGAGGPLSAGTVRGEWPGVELRDDCRYFPRSPVLHARPGRGLPWAHGSRREQRRLEARPGGRVGARGVRAGTAWAAGSAGRVTGPPRTSYRRKSVGGTALGALSLIGSLILGLSSQQLQSFLVKKIKCERDTKSFRFKHGTRQLLTSLHWILLKPKEPPVLCPGGLNSCSSCRHLVPRVVKTVPPLRLPSGAVWNLGLTLCQPSYAGRQP
ncbi:uncharacterized protein LOC110342774 isoform X1 [Mesocricetus auratus]|uniref:Uncharacterized protein LOC110342774 isoform X1 n=1 Tax=Mesocricetus auratus TaxID=10036 RepID=A0A3Q0D7H6_MESAU|nr:uncharacterized protein LOC110342774 isoform X1 [Mesocricetus auratus]XP_021088717.1 uncharacterized protein LOC110342774 isoform X1 [Mesocricetus auratus]XP_021088718.1 uncharacterized protein LOC110342774 isoform X1 [Mesocricetus auratus]